MLPLESLETRRLFNFMPFGSNAYVPLSDHVNATDVAVAGNGDYLVVAAGSTNGQWLVTLARYASNGELLSSGGAVHNQPLSEPPLTYVAAAVGHYGDGAIVYQTSEETATHIVARRITRNGLLSNPMTIATLARADRNDDPKLILATVDADVYGNFTVGWVSSVSEDDNTLHFHTYSPDGISFGNEIVVPTHNVGSQRIDGLSLSMNTSTNKMAFAYQTLHSDRHVSSIFAGQIENNAFVGSLQEINDGAVYGPSVATNVDGSFYVGYERRPAATLFAGGSSFTEADNDGRVQRFDVNGQKTGDPTQLGASLGNNGKGVNDPTIHRNRESGFVATYIKGTTLFTQRFENGGTSDESGPADLASNEFYKDLGIGVDVLGNAVVSYFQIDDSEYQLASVHTVRATSQIAALDNGTLYVVGTRKSDVMTVKQRGNWVFAGRGSEDALKISATRVKRIAMDGYNGNDRMINATSLVSTIRGGSGNDIIEGGSSVDILRGNTGDDDLSGNAGNDTMYGDDGNDILVGNDGNDSIDGGYGNDRLYGYAGNDRLFGSAGNDRLYGGAHNDTLEGGVGVDQLFGDAGTDFAAKDGAVDKRTSIERQ